MRGVGRVLSALACCAIVCVAPPSGAQPVVSAFPEGRLPSPVDRSPEPDPWYGETILAIDAASITAIVVGAFVLDDSDGSGSLGQFVGLAGLAGYLLGGFSIHWAHDRIGLAFLDLAGRIIGPYTAGLMAWRADGLRDQSQVALAALLGGLAIASFIDSFVLAREPPRPTTDRAPVVGHGRPLARQGEAPEDEDD